MKSAYKEDGFLVFEKKMRAEGIPDIAIRNFEQHYRQLVEGYTGIIRESDISPVDSIADADNLTEEHGDLGRQYLSKTVLLKLNGGLGTSMGLEKAKSLIHARDNHTFLDIIARHAIHSNAHLLLMNSFNTREESLQLLQAYPELSQSKVELDFLQHRVPKVTQEKLTLATSEDNELLEWCPPGHGDLYIALVSSGILDSLLHAGYQYALVSNADNLGATLDTHLLGYLVKETIPFLMEVTTRTEMDKKGGHLARGKDGRFILRETAQCSDDDRITFENISRHRYFNTNNLWIDLRTLHSTMAANNNIMDLPLIRNAKTIDPRNADSTKVYQLETAMGSAISTISGAQAIQVPRSRFAPVKTTNDLLLVRSDVYEIARDKYTLSCVMEQIEVPVIDLDNRYYKLIDDFESRFPFGSPSLLNCQELSVKGDILFGKSVSIKGKVQLENKSGSQIRIPDGTDINEDIIWD